MECASLSLHELHKAGENNDKEWFRLYRKYVYETGAVNKPGKSQNVIDEKILEKERKNDFQLSRYRKFKYRTKYFKDSWVIGSKEYVSSNYQQFKGMFYAKREKIPNPLKEFPRIYILKKLKE